MSDEHTSAAGEGVAAPPPAATATATTTAPTVRPSHGDGRLRATIIVNPYSSGLTAHRERVIVETLRELVELDVRRTERAGHASELARDAVADNVDLVIACGGDGTGNEVINGMQLDAGTAFDRPMFALLPAGGTNVLARSVGFPNDPVRALANLSKALAARRSHPITLGRLDQRMFLFSAGVGLDGAIVRRIEQKRTGRRPSDLSHAKTTVGLFMYERFVLRDRMTITVDDTATAIRAAMTMVSNTTPLTYIGRMPLHYTPDAKLEEGLSFMAPERVSAVYAISTSLRAMGVLGRRGRYRDLKRRNVHHDIAGLTVICDEPEPCQVDGEYIGDRTHIRFEAVPHALRFVY